LTAKLDDLRAQTEKKLTRDEEDEVAPETTD